MNTRVADSLVPEMYCFVGDLLGFRNIILNLPGDQQAGRVHEWIEFTQTAVSHFRLPLFQLVSDTIFAGTEDTQDGLRTLLAFAKHLLEVGLGKAFPLRGGITCGDVTWDRHVTFGTAVVRAYELATAQNWVGVSCEPTLPHIEALWDFDRVVCYPTPLKAGPIMLRPVVPWQVPPFQELARQMNREGLTHGGELLQWGWGEKVQNTIIFSVYLRMVRAGGDPSRFHGLLPTEIIDINIK